MSKAIKLKRGLDIRLVGEADRKLRQLPAAASYALLPDDYPGITPKLLVRINDEVKAGQALFFDKSRPELLFTSPVSGRVSAIERGEKRKILAVAVTPDANIPSEEFAVPTPAAATREAVIEVLLRSGLWTAVIQRPYGIIADPQQTPKAIFVSGFDSAPLAGDMEYMLAGQEHDLQTGFDILHKLTEGPVHLGLRPDQQGVLSKMQGVEITCFAGPHPAGNVGVQIHHVDPVNKGETVWTLHPQDVVAIGRLFNTGRLDLTRIIPVVGSEVKAPDYVSVIPGACIDSIVNGRIKPQPAGRAVRIISGNVLTGTRTSADGYLGRYAHAVTVIPEGNRHEMLGWALPRLNKFSVSHAYFSWMFPRKRYVLDTNLNGGERPFVVTGLYDKYLPMDIYPMYLLKAILAGDIDKMENLGIYEVVEEDFALCEFVDPSKIEMQQIIRRGLDQMIKEMS